MVEYIHPATGKIFVLTEDGKSITRVKAKYVAGTAQFNERYQRTAPKKWLDSGWIEEREV